MKQPFTFFRYGALCAALFFLLAGLASWAQSAESADTSESKVEDAPSQLELLNTYIHLQEKLHEAQLAIEKNRLEYQAQAREHAAAIAEKLNAIQTTLDAERVRQQQELQSSNRMLLWVAAGFGVVGLLAMTFTAMFQWRTISRVTEVSAWQRQLGAGPSPGLLPDAAAVAGKTVELSNERLMSVIERLERRVLELEHTTTTADSPEVVAAAISPGADGDGTAARIALLMGKGQAFLNEDQPEEAVACYDEILELDANHPEALVKKGAALERLKQDDEALRCYDRAIEADRTLTIAYLYKGGIFNRLERYNEALECYEQALRVQGVPS